MLCYVLHYILGLKLGWVTWIKQATFCAGQGQTLIIKKYPGMYDKDLALTALLEYFDLLAVHFESAGLLFSYQLQCLASVSIER